MKSMTSTKALGLFADLKIYSQPTCLYTVTLGKHGPLAPGITQNSGANSQQLGQEFTMAVPKFGQALNCRELTMSSLFYVPKIYKYMIQISYFFIICS